MVSIEKVPFAEGNLRRAYKMRDLTKTDGNDLFVAKMSKDKYEDIGVWGPASVWHGGPLGPSFFFWLRTAPRDHQPPTANCRQPPTANCLQPPTAANRCHCYSPCKTATSEGLACWAM